MNSHPIVVCADPAIVQILHSQADRLLVPTVSGDRYADIAEQLFPADGRQYVQPGAIIWDIRSSSDIAKAVNRCHDLSKLLQDLLFDAPVPRRILLLIDAHQMDARWLERHPIFQSAMGQHAGCHPIVLYPIDDGSWETSIGTILSEICSVPSLNALPA